MGATDDTYLDQESHDLRSLIGFTVLAHEHREHRKSALGHDKQWNAVPPPPADDRSFQEKIDYFRKNFSNDAPDTNYGKLTGTRLCSKRTMGDRAHTFRSHSNVCTSTLRHSLNIRSVESLGKESIGMEMTKRHLNNLDRRLDNGPAAPGRGPPKKSSSRG